jgi:hypothetical protein
MAWQVLTGTIKRAFLVLLRDTLRETAIWANSILIYTDPRRLADAARNALANGESVHAYLAHRSRREVEAAAGGLLGDLNRMVSNLDNLGEVGSRQIAANIRARQAELSGEMSEQLRGVAQHMPDMIALALNSAAEAIGPGWLSGIDEQLEELTDHWETAMGFMGMNVQGMADRWRAALRSVSNEAQQTANTAARQSITMTRAVTGHEAALEGGEKAFSLLFGSSSNQNFYQKATMEAVRRGNVDLGAIRRAFEQAPPIRRARI